MEVGAANNWSGMSVDRSRGIIFVPTGSAAYDFYGANRKGAPFSLARWLPVMAAGWRGQDKLRR